MYIRSVNTRAVPKKLIPMELIHAGYNSTFSPSDLIEMTLILGQDTLSGNKEPCDKCDLIPSYDKHLKIYK